MGEGSGVLTRRRVLLTLGAAAAAGCARAAVPTPASPVVAFDLGLTGADQVFVAPQPGGTFVRHEDAVFAATNRWFTPVISAFNDRHRGLRASFAPFFMPSDGERPGPPNPRISVLVGEWGGQDLASALRSSNMDTSVLLPGLLQAGQDASGNLRGVPVGFSPYAVGYGPTKSLDAARIAAPQATWSTDQFVAFCRAVAADGGGFWGEVVRGFLGRRRAWIGFVEGYGGSVLADGRLALTTAAALQGLNAFADLLAVTWNRGGRVAPVLTVGLSPYDRTAPHPVRTPVVRFPRAPIPVVPAVVDFASVPDAAPQPAAGATFAIWLLSRAGQQALTAVGFPAVRTDTATTHTWLTHGPAAVNPAHLRFAPPQLKALEKMQFAARLYRILTSAPPLRPPALRQLEQVADAVLAGDTNPVVAGGRLNQAGILQ